MSAVLVGSGDGWEVWHGDCLDPGAVVAVMGDRKADLLCVDAPYSERTHAGHDGAADSGDIKQAVIPYAFWSPGDVQLFCGNWLPRCSGWVASITDHVLSPHWESCFSVGRYAFAPLPFVELGGRVRVMGDGPSGWTCWLMVARPRNREFATWGTLPGAYVQNAERDPMRVTGGKPIAGMCRLVADYSRRGGLVVDPCCGGGTTLRAARMTGRRCIGMDRDRERAELSARRLAGAREQTSLFEGVAS